MRVLACCGDGTETLSAVRQHRPDILILDIRMPKMDGLAVLREMRRDKCATCVVVPTASLTEDEVLKAIRCGAWGVVLKEMAPRLLVKCLRKVHAGERWAEAGFYIPN